MGSLKRMAASDSRAQNIANKIYVRSTKKGKVQKIITEQYLRSDIPCSSKLCANCLQNAPQNAAGEKLLPVLSAHPESVKNYPHGVYLVPDTNVLLNGMDLFEQSSAFCDVIILQIVLEEVRNQSLPLYNRLIGLTRSDEKRFYVFFNEFHIQTVVQRLPNETMNDKNDRAIRRAVKWYNRHLRKCRIAQGLEDERPTVLLLSNDKDNLAKALADQIPANTLEQFVSCLDDRDKLLDMIAVSDSGSAEKATGDNLYPEHYSLSRMMAGISEGYLHQGIFNVSQYNYLEGSVKVPAFGKPLIILGRENINRAVNGDKVVVQVLPSDQWKSPSTKIIEEEAITKNENPDVDDDGEVVITEQETRALREQVKRSHAKSTVGSHQPTAQIVGISERNWRLYVGHIDPASVNAATMQGRRQDMVFVIPMDKKIPKIRIRTRQSEKLVGQRVLVAIDSWDRNSRHPMGHLVRSLGEMETKAAETEALLLEWDVQYRPFPKTVLDCLPPEGHDWRVPQHLDDPGWVDRQDLRDLLICSIDPVGCQDIDDALHARQLANGNYEVGVHIADVSHFVRANNAMDSEASIRGTTVYLVDKRIDMLPTLLGTDLCSLKPYVERYAFSVIWEMTPSADILSARFTKSVIKSREAFSYEQAQMRIDDGTMTDDLTNGMRALLRLSKNLKQKRMDAGALSLSSPEVKIQMESETSDPIDIKTKQLLDTNSLVEEFMLLANTSVATKIYEAFPQTAVLRRHAAPPATFFDELALQLRVRRGIQLKFGTSRELADSLDECVDPSEPFFNTLIRILATRCMTSAEYFTAGTQTYSEFRHYGLASEIYTHFTSPIRRYADLMAHRQLAAAIEYEPLHPSQRSRGRLEVITKNLNVRHRNAQMAGRASVEYYVGQALKSRKEPAVEEGWVMKIFSNGFVVLVPKLGIEGVIRLNDIAEKAPEVEFDAENFILKFTKSRNFTIALFDKVIVKVMDKKDEASGKRGVKMELVRTL